MPRRQDLRSILLIGSGPIVIGQACEFDYSGTQAVKALKEEGYRVTLVNSNPATIMTDPELADATYVEPLTVEVLEKIIAVERPDALLPTLGGQTALNLAVAAAKSGVLERHGVELIGASVAAIEKAEDRELFKRAMTQIGLEVPRHPPPLVHPRRLRRRRRHGRAGAGGEGRLGAPSVAAPRDPARGIRARLEGIRAGGDARRQGQRRHH